MKQELHAKLTVRIFADQKCFGPGVAELLRRVRELHSLRAAAMSMNMAYSKAWTVLRTAQDDLGFKLLHSSTGGKNGGGATLTPEGERMLAAYEDYCARLNAYSESIFAETFDFYHELTGEDKA